MTLYIDPLQKNLHNRQAFDCGLSAVNEFLQRQARRQMDQRINRTWVIVDSETAGQPPCPIAGYFTLTNATVVRDELPSSEPRSRLPGYPIPVIKLAWLGVATAYQGTEYRLGETLLLEALEQACRIVDFTELGMAVVTDPLTQQSNNFFRKYGFEPMGRPFGDFQTLYLPMSTARQLV